MSTTKLYQSDVYTKEWDATVTKITENGIYFDQTAFFPEGGGQSCDLGTVQLAESDSQKLQIIDVQEDGDDVIHRLSSYEGPLKPEDIFENMFSGAKKSKKPCFYPQNRACP